MKKIVFAAAIICFSAYTTSLLAQDTKGEKGDKGEKGPKETQEIIIRKKGEKDTRVSVEINGDNITVNGKPLSEYKDDDITINKRNIIIREGKKMNPYSLNPEDIQGFTFSPDDNFTSGAFLGVTTGVHHDGSDKTKPNGAEITNITKGSAAEKAGLKNGDVIVKINNKKIEDPETLSKVISEFKPNTEITVHYKREGKESSVKATLGDRKDSRVMAYSFTGPNGYSRSYTLPRMETVPGVEFWNNNEPGDMTARVWTPRGETFDRHFENVFPRQQKLGVKIQDTEDGNGVKILEVDKDSPAEKAGLKKDDVVTEIAGKKISNTDDMREQLMDQMEKSTYNIKASRNGNPMSIDIKIPKKLKTANL